MKRINSGIYQTEDGKFQIELAPCGLWDLFKMVNGGREWINDYLTKRDAAAAIKQNR